MRGRRWPPIRRARRFLPVGNTRDPISAVGDESTWSIGGQTIELHHARGETDDHLWAWFPERSWVMTGDFVIWNFPNAGNPQKVQRYPIEWAAALRAMIAKQPELLVPAHGLPIAGQQRIARVLGRDRHCVGAVGGRGDRDDERRRHARHHRAHRSVPSDTLAKPYLRPFYDEPEFVVRNVWRQFGGWWDGAASRLKPSPDAQLATVLAELAGGVDEVVRRAERAAGDNDLRLACHLADIAGWAAPDDARCTQHAPAIYMQRRTAESSLMSKGIFAAAARESQMVVERDD